MLRLIYLVNLSPSRRSVIISCYQWCLWSPPHHHRRKEKANYSQLYDIVILNCSRPSEKNISRQRCFHLPRWLKDVHLVVFYRCINDNQWHCCALVFFLCCRMWLRSVGIWRGELRTEPLSHVRRLLGRRRRGRPLPLRLQLPKCAPQHGRTSFKASAYTLICATGVRRPFFYSLPQSNDLN